MAIIGFNFNKVMVERKSMVKGNININNNISIKDIDKMDITFAKDDQQGLKFSFEFVSKYDPDIGEIRILGEVIVLEPKKKAEDIAKQWKKDKKIDAAVMNPIFQAALEKCHIEALILSRDVNLPPSLPLRLKPKEN